MFESILEDKIYDISVYLEIPEILKIILNKNLKEKLYKLLYYKILFKNERIYKIYPYINLQKDIRIKEKITFLNNSYLLKNKFEFICPKEDNLDVLISYISSNPNLLISGGYTSSIYLEKEIDDESDFDIFIIDPSTRNIEMHNTELEYIHEFKILVDFIHDNYEIEEVIYDGVTVRTFILKHTKRKIQIICNFFKNVIDVLMNFDCSHVRCAYYMGDTYITYDCENSKKTKTTYFCKNIKYSRYIKTLKTNLKINNYINLNLLTPEKINEKRIYKIHLCKDLVNIINDKNVHKYNILIKQSNLTDSYTEPMSFILNRNNDLGMKEIDISTFKTPKEIYKFKKEHKYNQFEHFQSYFQDNPGFKFICKLKGRLGNIGYFAFQLYPYHFFPNEIQEFNNIFKNLSSFLPKKIIKECYNNNFIICNKQNTYYNEEFNFIKNNLNKDVEVTILLNINTYNMEAFIEHEWQLENSIIDIK